MLSQPRPRWADLQDSSQENVPDSDPAPVSQSSYRGLSQDSPEDHRSVALSEQLTRATTLRGAPRSAQRAPQHSPVTLAEVDIEDEVEDAVEAPVTAGSTVAAGTSPQGATSLNKVLSPLSDRLRSWRPTSQHEPTKALAAPQCVIGGSTAASVSIGPSPAPNEPNESRPPPFTPSRRRARQRYEVRMGEQTPGGKRLRSAIREPSTTWAVPGLPEATPEEWERRLRKRHAAVVAIKAMPEYHQAATLRAAGAISAEELPLTPDPEDTTASKRQWESSVMQWRSQLRQLIETS